ncbi:MAG: branched-chain amino acid ABC transporter permease [Rhizobiaceae bacterium]
MEVFLQQSVNAISLGGIYALLALGLAVVFSIVRLINFAHGEVMTVAGYAIWIALASSVPVAAAVLLGVAVAMLASVAMERVAFRAMRGANVTSLLITSFAVSEIIKVLFQNGITARPVPIVLPAWMSGSVNVGFLTISVMSIISITVVILSLIALSFILKRTTLGIAMRAAAEDFPVVRLVGIKANQVVALAFAISGVLAGITAVLWVAQRGSVDPVMGSAPVLKAFIATVLGGLGSLSGAVAGGFAVGIVEVFLQGYLPESVAPYREAISLSIIIALLVWRPDGLLPAQNVNRS